MEEKVDGIVLCGVNYGENDKILSIFTLEYGVVSAKIKGVKKAGAKLKFAAEPFCFAEFTFSRRGDFRTVTGASLIDSFYPVRENLEKFFCGGTILEFVKRFEKENIVSPETFSLSVEALKRLAYGDDEPKSVLCGFLLSALSISGYGLNLGGCAVCGKIPDGRIFFDYKSGAFLCADCFDGDGREINRETFLALKTVADGGALNSAGAVKALKLLNYYLTNKPEERLNSLVELLGIVS